MREVGGKRILNGQWAMVNGQRSMVNGRRPDRQRRECADTRCAAVALLPTIASPRRAVYNDGITMTHCPLEMAAAMTETFPGLPTTKPTCRRPSDVPSISVPHLLAGAAARYPAHGAVRMVLRYLPLGLKIQASPHLRRLERLSDRFCRSAGWLGIAKGDRVAIMLPNLPQQVIAFFGVLRPAPSSSIPLTRPTRRTNSPVTLLQVGRHGHRHGAGLFFSACAPCSRPPPATHHLYGVGRARCLVAAHAGRSPGACRRHDEAGGATARRLSPCAI